MNRDDLGEMIQQQVPRLRRYARALIRDLDEADDLVQDCLVRAWRGVDQWHPEQDLRVWLFSIMHNLKANTGGSTAEAYRDGGFLGGDSAKELGGVENGLAHLAEDQHEVLLLVCVEEMNYEQVAKVMGVPVGTVVTRLHRAREHLRRWMNREQRPSLRRVK